MEFNKLLIDGQSYGRSSHVNEYIQLNPTNTDAQNNITFWHEVLHTISLQQIGVSCQEDLACCLSEGIASILKQMNINLDFSKLEGKE